ncbi:hypothetical protein BC830DRAFT_423084 [Chytriomyces sp. MP71]|nr:hypothetical protein BC830DRAFT_423084 [Chytriomyces sp. MP71]
MRMRIAWIAWWPRQARPATQPPPRATPPLRTAEPRLRPPQRCRSLRRRGLRCARVSRPRRLRPGARTAFSRTSSSGFCFSSPHTNTLHKVNTPTLAQSTQSPPSFGVQLSSWPRCKEQPPTASAKDLRVDSKMNVFDSLFEVKHNGSNGPIALDPLKQREPKHSRKTIPALPRSTYGFLYSRVWWRFTVSYAKMTFKVFGIAAVMMFVWVFLNAKLMDSLPSIYPAKRLETIKQPSSESIVRRTRELDRILTQRDSPVIHLMWTTPSSTFSFLNYKVLDSYLYHDAFTSIIIHATHLNESHFRSYTQAGYRVTVKKLTDESILDLATTPTSPSPNPCPGVEWLHNMPLYRKTSPYFYSHLTDYLRFCILYKHGGIYSDFDAIQLSRWNHPDEDSSSPIGNAFIGADSATGAETPNLGSSTIINHENGHHPIKVSSASSSAPHQKTPVCPWCFHHGDTYLAPGVMGTPPSHPLVHRALEIGFERMVYDPLAFNAVGPKAVTLAFQELEREGGGHVDGVQVLKRGLLYPYSYLTSWRVFRRVEVPSGTRETTAESGFDMAAAETTVEAAVDRISRNSLSLHLYGHVTKGLKVEDGSMLDYLVRKQTVVIQGSVLGLNGSHDGGSTEWIGHKLKAPRFLSVARYVELVPDVRITVDTRGLEESDKIMNTLTISLFRPTFLSKASLPKR